MIVLSEAAALFDVPSSPFVHGIALYRTVDYGTVSHACSCGGEPELTWATK